MIQMEEPMSSQFIPPNTNVNLVHSGKKVHDFGRNIGRLIVISSNCFATQSRTTVFESSCFFLRKVFPARLKLVSVDWYRSLLPRVPTLALPDVGLVREMQPSPRKETAPPRSQGEAFEWNPRSSKLLETASPRLKSAWLLLNVTCLALRLICAPKITWSTWIVSSWCAADCSEGDFGDGSGGRRGLC